MRGIEMRVGHNRMPDGSHLRVMPHREKRVQVKGTPLHEAKHAVPGERVGAHVKKVALVNSGSVRGITEFATYHPVPAIAPHATGEAGGLYDKSLVEHMGDNVGAAASVAQSIVAENEEQIDAVAAALQQEGTLSGTRVRAIIAEVDEEIIYGPRFDAILTRPTGEQAIITEVRQGELIDMIQDELYDLEAA